MFETLPVELIADILSELDLESLIKISYLSRRLHHIASDSSLNPWRQPILRALHSGSYDDCLKHLSVRSTVPRQNWLEILSLAQPAFLLYEATLPNMKACEWEECFKRRFLPGWRKWKKDSGWKEAFMKLGFQCVLIWAKSHNGICIGWFIECGIAAPLLALLMNLGPSEHILSHLFNWYSPYPSDILFWIAMELLTNWSRHLGSSTRLCCSTKWSTLWEH